MGTEPANTSQPTRRRPVPVAVKAAIRTACHVLTVVAARAQAAEAAGPEEIRHVKSLLHRVQYTGLKSTGELRAHVQAMEDYAAHLASCLADGENILAQARAATTEAPSGQPSGRKRRRPVRRRAATVLTAVSVPADAEGGAAVPADGAAVIPPTRGRRTSTRRLIPLDELDDDQRALVAKHRELMRLMDGGMQWKEALAQVGLERSERWVYKLRRRWAEHDVAGLYDLRWTRVTKVVVSDEIQQRTLHWYVARRGAGPKAIYELVCKDCDEQGWPPPSYEWVKKFLQHLPAGIKLAREKGMREWERQAAPVGEYNPTTFANEAWQVDHCRVDGWFRVQTRDGRWVQTEVWVTAVLDIHSRAIMAIVVSTRAPNAWTSAMAIRTAILPKRRAGWPMRGKPLIVVTDHGKDLKARSVVSSVRALGIRFELCAPYYPNMKGEVERWFRTFQEGHLVKFPGYKRAGMKSAEAAAKHVGELLTPEEFTDELEQWIVSVYHRRIHEGISVGPVDRTPARLWEETVRLDEMDPAKLDVLILQSDKVRTVTHKGIKLKLKSTGRMVFWSPALAALAGTKVRLRYNPHDFASVIVYRADTGERICEAWRMGVKGARYGHGDIVAARKQARKGVAARLAAREEQRQQDMNRAPEAWDRAREIAARAATAGQPARGGTAASAQAGPRAGAQAGTQRASSAAKSTAASAGKGGATPTSKQAPKQAPRTPAKPAAKPVTKPAATHARKPAKPAAGGVLSLLEAMERKDRGVA